MEPTAKLPPALRLSAADARFRKNGNAAAARTVGPITHGCRVIGLTYGQFGVLELLRHVLATTGPADVDLVTWSMRPADARHVAYWARKHTITRLRVLFGTGIGLARHREREVLPKLFSADQVRFATVHAKWFRVHNAQWDVTCRSSMNVNRCVRWEQFDLDDDPRIGHWYGEILDSAWETQPVPWEAKPDRREVDRAAFGTVATTKGTTKRRRGSSRRRG